MAKTIGIFGYGQFGKFVHEILRKHLEGYQIKISSGSRETDNETFFDFEEVAKCDILIPCVPISAFENNIKQVAKHIKPEALVIDVCSIKVYPKKVMLEHLPENVEIVASHPMFGPESYKKSGYKLDGLNMVIENVRCDGQKYEKTKEFLKNLELNVIEMDADKHDRFAADSHFVSLYVAGYLKKLDLKRSKIDTLSFSKMMDFIERIGADDLITKDMLKYNPYCLERFDEIEQAHQELKDYFLD